MRCIFLSLCVDYENFIDTLGGSTLECTVHSMCNTSAYCALDDDAIRPLPFCRACVEGTGNAALGCNDRMDAIDGMCPSYGKTAGPRAP